MLKIKKLIIKEIIEIFIYIYTSSIHKTNLFQIAFL